MSVCILGDGHKWRHGDKCQVFCDDSGIKERDDGGGGGHRLFKVIY